MDGDKHDKYDRHDIYDKDRDRASNYLIGKLERRLGILLTDSEIHSLMNDMNCNSEDISNDIKKHEFLNKMMKSIRYGARMTKHSKRSEASHRWILINNDRLYFKKSIQDRNHRSRSIKLREIRSILSGKQTRVLRNCESANDDCCFSIIANNMTLDLQCENEDMCNEWFHYLKMLQKHFAK